MLLQVQASLGSVSPFASSSLFIVWGGPDDFITEGTVAQGVTDELGIVPRSRASVRHTFSYPACPTSDSLRRTMGTRQRPR